MARDPFPHYDDSFFEATQLLHSPIKLISPLAYGLIPLSSEQPNIHVVGFVSEKTDGGEGKLCHYHGRVTD